MRFHWLLVLLIPAAVLIGAWSSTAREAREQTVFLERMADTVEQTLPVPPETSRAVKDAIASIRERATPANEDLVLRQTTAIERIERSSCRWTVPREREAASRGGDYSAAKGRRNRKRRGGASTQPEQRLGTLEIGCVERFIEPSVNRREKISRLLRSVPIAPNPREARGRSQLP